MTNPSFFMLDIFIVTFTNANATEATVCEFFPDPS